jgi:hypothetical protein
MMLKNVVFRHLVVHIYFIVNDFKMTPGSMDKAFFIWKYAFVIWREVRVNKRGKYRYQPTFKGPF